MVLDGAFVKKARIAILGQDVYQNIFAEIKRVARQEEATRESKNWQVIDGQYVGRKYTKATKGTPEVDPAVCSHAAQNMRSRGNGRQNWWTCIACLTRWERIPIEIKDAGADATDHDVLAFGKHAGKTYLEVLTDHPSYAKWVISTDEYGDNTNKQFAHFARWIRKKEYEEANGPDNSEISDMEMVQDDL